MALCGRWTEFASEANGNQGKRVEVHAFQPLDNGRIMIAESGPARIIEIAYGQNTQPTSRLLENPDFTYASRMNLE